MRILFVAPRFHTNQYPTTRDLVKAGHEIYYYVQNRGITEDYKHIKPVYLKLSPLGRLVNFVIRKKYDKPTAESKMIERFIPSYLSIYRTIKKINPELVILRDRIPTTLLATRACKKLGIKNVILYNQNSLYTDSKENPSLLKRWVFKHCPQVRYTISYINNLYDYRSRKEDFYIKEHEYFVPYVSPYNENARGREYFAGGKLNIIDMGKFRPYKNHYLFVDAIALLRERGAIKDIAFTILGQASYDEEIDYFNKLGEYIKEKNLDDLITLRKNIPYSEMSNLYMTMDVFVLCSYNELATISVLETMSNGVVPVSTSHNGTACYIKENETGLTFETRNVEDLADKIQYLSENRDKVVEMGQAGHKYIEENCLFDNYYSALNEITVKEFGFSIKEYENRHFAQKK